MWQLRLIGAGGTCLGSQSFVAHFGLGDATKVDVLRVEWPSGIVQELREVATNQFLTITEPVKLEATGAGQFRIGSWQGMVFNVESSANLSDWQPVTTVTNLTGQLEFTDPDTAGHQTRFYRVATR